MTPSTIATPGTALTVESVAASGSLSTTDTGNPHVDLVMGSCTGTGVGTFALTPNTNIALNNPATIDVTYTPTAGGMRSCTVNVFPNGTNTGAPLTTFTVTGDGLRPAMLSLTNPAAEPVQFTAVRTLDSAVAPHTSMHSITITNSGDIAANVSAVMFDSTEFSVLSGSTGSIAPNGGTRSWTIVFNPSASGTRNATATFVNDSSVPNLPVTLRGDGTTGLFTLDSTPLDFNTVASGSSATIDIDLDHAGGDPRGTLTITDASISNASATWFSVSAAPATIGPPGGDTGTVTVKCAPPDNATTTETAQLDVTADVDSAPATMSVSLTCTGGAAVLALDSSSFNFGNQLVGSPTDPQTINISNTGSTNAIISLTSSSLNASRFAVEGPTCSPGMGTCTVNTGASIPLMLTFTPMAEGQVSASFTVAVQGQAGAPLTGFTLSGKGIDNHIIIPESVQFEDTFRNPGDKATVAPITIQNQGEYPLDVTSLAIANNMLDWSIVDPTEPFTIEGLGSQDVLVKFAPHGVGKAEDGLLVVSNTDMKVAGGMPQIVLSGNGRERNVSATPGSIVVGDTFAGVPTRVSISNPGDLLVLVNNEAPDDSPLERTNFVINHIEVSGDDMDAFEAVELGGGSLDGHALPAGAMTSVDVIFKPTHVGEYSAVLAVYLDEDTEPQALIPIRGRALWADANGSGGCAAGHDSHGGLVLVLGVLGLATRRRRR
jgi:MYXO-CTERM domain-containing protein